MVVVPWVVSTPLPVSVLRATQFHEFAGQVVGDEVDAVPSAGLRLAARRIEGDWSILWLRKRRGY